QLRFRLATLSEHLARRADELEQFAGRVAHDIRGPLTAANLGLTCAVSRDPEPELRAIIDRVQRSAARIGTIVDGLLRFARAGARPDPGVCTALRPTLQELISELEPIAAQEQIQLVLAPLPDCTVVGNAGVLTSLVENLVRNALKYMG